MDKELLEGGWKGQSPINKGNKRNETYLVEACRGGRGGFDGFDWRNCAAGVGGCRDGRLDDGDVVEFYEEFEQFALSAISCEGFDERRK